MPDSRAEKHSDSVEEPRSAPAPARGPLAAWKQPPLSLLDVHEKKSSTEIDRELLLANAELLEKRLAEYGVTGKVKAVLPGPVITRYELEPAPGVKVSRILALADDLSLAMKATSIRILAPVPGKAVVGIEIPNAEPETVFMRDILVSDPFQTHKGKLPLALGKDISGNAVVADMVRMPHLLIAGATGSGKSVSLNSMICSMLYRASPDEVKFIMIDPKMLELSPYEGIPHLMLPVVTDMRKAAVALQWAVTEMERRYKKLASYEVRNIDGYNQAIAEELKIIAAQPGRREQLLEEGEETPEKLHYLVIVIDELADVVEVEVQPLNEAILRLAQLGATAGIHLLVSTQRPSARVLSEVAKAHFGARIAFRMVSDSDMAMVIGCRDAERLLGNGDMLILAPGTSKLTRIHGSYLSDGEIARIIQHWKKQGRPIYDKSILDQPLEDDGGIDGPDDYDEKYDEALAFVSQLGHASISLVQRRFRIAYNRAARIIERMEREAVIGPADGAKPRQVLVNRASPLEPRNPAPATALASGAAAQAPAVEAPALAQPKTEVPDPPAAPSVVGPSPEAVVQGRDAAQRPTALTAPLAAVRRFVFGSVDLSTTPATPTAMADRLWYPKGRSVRVGSDLVPDGMLYVGDGLPSVSGGFATEAALLDPKLPRALPPAGVASAIPYWPNYAGLSPEARGYYVRWLLDGRRDPATPVGYVFLFFYGIERRLLADAETSESARSETPGLLEEVERLLAIYGQNGSFHGYATDFLNAIRAQRGLEVPLDLTSTLSARSPELPLGIRVGVGRFIAAAQPIPADWALAWVCADPETRLGTVARRCRDELRELFVHRYQAEFGAGMMLEPNKTSLALEYRCASPSFAGSAVTVRVSDLPDIAPLSKPVNALRVLLESCADDLDGFSRLVGRSPGEASSIRALALLPKELLLTRETPELAELRAWLEGLVPADEPMLVAARELFSRLALDSAEIRKADGADTARLLERLGFGVEPDVRFGTRVPKLDEPVVLFRTPASEEGLPTGAFQAAAVVLRLAAEVAACDAEISEAEQQELEGQLERALDLDPGERRRLRAHLKWLVAARPGFAGLKKHIERLDAGGRSRIAQYAVAIAAADGHVDSAEIKTLQKIYRALELEPDQVFAHVHDAQAMPTRTPTEPVTIREAGPAPAGFRVPDAPPNSREGVVLDRRAIERKLAETAEVSSLLSRIFADDEATASPSSLCGPDANTPHASDPAAVVVVAGLDEAGTALLRGLADVQTISRSDFEALAAERGMLPDGAIEALNEAAYQRCDEPALEGDDPIEVNAAVIKEMLR